MEEFLKPLGISQYRLSKDISVPPRRINEIVYKLRGISADTALRLARYFGNSPQFWMNLQTWYDLEMEKRKLAEKLIKRFIHLREKLREIINFRTLIFELNPFLTVGAWNFTQYSLNSKFKT